MSREHIYKAKAAESGAWLKGDLIHKIDVFGGHQTCIYQALGKGRWQTVIVDKSTVCEYTGLLDKNKRKIFEGDICKDGDNIVRILWNDKHQWGVEILKTDTILSRGLTFPLWQYDNCKENGNREFEVIGNIFDNPELLKGDVAE